MSIKRNKKRISLFSMALIMIFYIPYTHTSHHWYVLVHFFEKGFCIRKFKQKLKLFRSWQFVHFNLLLLFIVYCCVFCVLLNVCIWCRNFAQISFSLSLSIPLFLLPLFHALIPTMQAFIHLFYTLHILNEAIQ